MTGRREALIIATGTYQDPELGRLRSPAQDATAIAEVLGDPAIGEFQVRQLVDQPSYHLTTAIERFFKDRGLHDLLLVHMSCHGVKDDNGLLYFAATNTDKQLLASTAVPGAFLREQMEYCRARSIVLLLDCCSAARSCQEPRATRACT
jgi:molecular chaperone DnaJ